MNPWHRRNWIMVASAYWAMGEMMYVVLIVVFATEHPDRTCFPLMLSFAFSLISYIIFLIVADRGGPPPQ